MAMIWCLQLSFSCWRSRLRLGVSVVGVMVSMIRTQPDPSLLLLWAWLRMVWDLSVILHHYAMIHCSTCNAYYSRCVHALGLQSIGGFDFDLLLWSGMLWRLIWLYCWTGVFSSWIHATQISSLSCGYDCSCRLARPWILWVRMIEVASFMIWPLKPRPTTMSTVIILCFICMTHDSWTHITFWIELWISSFSSRSMSRLHIRERHSHVFVCSDVDYDMWSRGSRCRLEEDELWAQSMLQAAMPFSLLCYYQLDRWILFPS